MFSKMTVAALCAAGLVGFTMTASTASATIAPGTYQLFNHPDGNQNPPPYGLRLDELYDATTSHDVFTFDFNHPSSYVTMTYTGSTITITGNARGGRDAGTVHAADAYLGLYSFNFVYNIGVGLAPGDDDVLVNPAIAGSNTGWIMTPLGDTIALRDESNGDFTFRLGDEDNDLGHRGFAGISGWGWLTHGPSTASHVHDSDWIFTVGPLVPSPSAAGGLVLGGVLAARRRRR
jgi:hypothetical protein